MAKSKPKKLTTRLVNLVITFDHVKNPVEEAMQKAGFRLPDADEDFMCGYLPGENGWRYFETRTPIWMKQHFNHPRKDGLVVDVDVEFTCTFMKANEP